MKKGKAATIRDVAERAGVGVGTVSRVINNSPTVSQATRQRVQKAVAKLNYSPNPMARHLSLGKTMKIAVIAPFFTRPAFVERLCGIESVLAPTAYDLIVYNVETPEKRDFYLREVPQRKRVDGVLILSLSPRDEKYSSSSIAVSHGAGGHLNEGPVTPTIARPCEKAGSTSRKRSAPAKE